MSLAQTIKAHGVIIHKRQYAPLHEFLPLLALGRKLAWEFENGAMNHAADSYAANSLRQNMPDYARGLCERLNARENAG